MKYVMLGFAVFAVLASCQNPQVDNEIGNENKKDTQLNEAETPPEKMKEDQTDKGKLGNIERGMTVEEVKEITGEPDRIDQLNANPESKVEDWYYGDNQKIRFVRDVVNRVVYDLDKESKLLKEIIKAKQAGNKEKAKSLIEELESLDEK